MPKQLNVNLAFTADTAQAKRQIQDLQQTLERLSSSTIKNNIGKEMNEELRKSVVSANQLKDMLQKAVNPKTGNLDLSRFSEQLKASGKQIEDYANDLNNLGPNGTKAFMQLAQSVASAEVPMKRTNALVKEFGTTLMNAARWQFSSSVLHGFMGAIQGAYGYAQDLNRSLTDIAIVTGNSVDNMAAFADQANKSAQALSTSTLAYTDAALIYYQQGLDDEAVRERTETTLKLSNVTRQSAEEVSSYMTAIWNNFYDGSQTLESFADKITALGAATASSSEEIAKGLNQFAALGSSLGLNYDDATAALATVVAQTRQSASTVGNSFRTLFQRIESLKLGETLEDGVDLTKYSAALEKVGVQILDVNGEMRDMHAVIEDLGAVWQNLSKAQQNALAQTVGGVRNSNTLIAWMDNFGEFQKNLGIAQNAEGTLQEQADIYAQSWEAAQKRVKAAWQAIYQDLINDDFFISILDGIEKVLHGIDSLIDGMGGLKGVLGVIGALVTTVFADGLAKGIQNAVYNFKVFTGQAQADADALAVQFKNVADQMGQDLQTPTATAEVAVLKDQIDFALRLRQAGDSITESNKAQLLSLNEITKEYGEAYVNAVKLKEAAEDAKSNATYNARDLIGEMVSAGDKTNARNAIGNILSTQNLNDNITNYQTQAAGIENFSSVFENAGTNYNDYIQVLKDSFSVYDEVIDHTDGLYDEIQKTIGILQNSTKTDLEKQDALKGLGQAFKEAGQNSNGLVESVRDKVVTEIGNLKKQFSLTDEQLQQLQRSGKAAADAAVDLAQKTEEADNAQNNYNERLKQAQQEFDNLRGKVSDYSTRIVTCARGMSQLWAAFNAFEKALDSLNNKDLTWAEKLKAIIPSLLTGLPMLINGLRTLTGVQGGLFAAFGAGIKSFQAASALGLGGLEALKFGFGALIGSIGATISAMLPFIAVAAGVGAAIFGLVKAFQAWKATTPEGQLEAANKELEKASEEASEATQAYNDLINTTNEYKSARESIAEMDDGAERNRAVSEENQKILDLLKTVDNWKEKIGELEYDDSGLIKLEEWQLKVLENDSAREASLKRQAELEAEINKQKAEQANGNSQYSGKGIVAGEKTYGGQDKNIAQYTSWDVTEEVAKALASAGFSNLSGLRSDAGKEQNEKTANQIQAILDSIGLKDNVADILGQLVDIANNEKEAASFEQLIALNTDALNNIDLTEKELQKEQYNQSIQDLGGDKLLSDFTSFDQAKQELAQAFQELSSEEQERIAKEVALGTSLTEAWSDFSNIIAEANQKARESIYNDIGKEIGSGEDDAYSRGVGQDQLNSWLETLSDQDLQILAKLEIDGDETLEELKVKLGEAQQIAEDNKISIKIDDDIDEDELNALGKYLKENAAEVDGLEDSLVHLGNASKKVASAILRFDDAIQDVTDNYSDWNEALKSENMQDMAKAAAEMTDAYGDMLDIDGSSLSADFLTNAENLELMKQAAEGSEEAYNKLRDAARDDIITHVFLDDEQAQADAYALNDVLQSELKDLEIGAMIDDAGVYQQMNQLINAADMTAQEATDLLASMGVDAEVEEVKVPKDQKQAFVDAIPETTYDTVQVPTIVQDDNGATVDNTTVQVPRIVYNPESKFEVAEGEETVTALRVTSARKSSGGGFKFNNSTHGGGNGGAGKKGGSGGKKGGGGGSKPKKLKTEKPKEHKENIKEKDRYHNIKEEIEDLNTEMDRLNKNKDRAYGKSRIKYMDQEISKTKEQIKLTQKYIDEIKRYAVEDRAALEKTLKAIGMSDQDIAAQFDQDGVLKDYEGLLDAIQTKFDQTVTSAYNNAIDEYNRAAAIFTASDQGDAATEAFDKAKEALSIAEETYNKQKETYDKQLESLKQYEETINLLQDKEQELIDQMNDLYDKQLELVKEKVDINVSLNEDDLKLLEWQLGHLGESLDHAADRIANLGKQMDANARNMAHYQAGIEGIFANHNVDIDLSQYKDGASLLAALEKGKNDLTGVLTDEEVQTIRDYRDALMEAYDNMRELTDQVTENVTNAYDEWNDKLDEQIEKFDKYKDFIATWKEIAELTGKNALGLSDQDVLKFQQQMVDTAQDAVQAAKDIADAHAAEVERLKQILANSDLTEYERAEYEKMLKVEEEYAEAAKEQALEKFKEALQEAEELFNQTLEANANTYKKMMSGGLGSLDLLQEQFNRQKKLSHLYLDNYEKYKKLGDLTAQINKNLTDVSSIKIQEKLNTLLDDINSKMGENYQISEGEAEILARRLALLQAEMQLEDARNAKSAVRMTRDNEGNFSYTYTADQDAISEAQQNYADKFYDLLDYERNLQEDMQDQMLQTMAEFVDKRNEIWNDTLLTDEERKAALEKLYSDYDVLMQFFADQFGMTMDEMKRLRDDDWMDFEDILNRKLASQDDFIVAFEDTLLGTVVPGWESIIDVMDSWGQSSAELYRKDNEAFTHWQEENASTWELAGYNVDKGADEIQKALNGVEEESNAAAEATKKMAQEMNNAMDGIISKAGIFYDSWADYMEKSVKKVNTMSTALNELLRLLGEVDDKSTGSNNNNSSSSSSSTGNGSGGGGPTSKGGSGTSGKLTIGTVATYTGGAYYSTSYGGGNTGNRGPGKKVRVTYMNPGAPYPIHVESSDSAYGWLREDQLTGYDTGGFTGKWGKDGKLAVLHEKELVLNKDDTGNLLNVVDMVRKITTSLNLQNNSLNLTGSRISEILNAGFNKKPLEQNVHISASFPNVQSHNEIELAMSNLINSATQYVNRK